MFHLIRTRSYTAPLTQDTTGQLASDGCSLNKSCENCNDQPSFICSVSVEQEIKQARQDATEKVLGEVREIIGKGLPDTEHTLGRIIDYLQEKGR